jgi:hypothetical protein
VIVRRGDTQSARNHSSAQCSEIEPKDKFFSTGFILLWKCCSVLKNT